MTDMTSDATYVFDPFAPGFTDDPYPEYTRLREAGPVHENPLGFWVVSGYDEVRGLLRAGHSVEERHVAPGPMQELNDAVYGDREERMEGLSMLDRDPPDHTRLRKLVSRAFTPKTVAALEPKVERLVDDALDRIADAGRVDLVEALAYPLPFSVITEMLGMPEADHARMRELAGVVVRSLEPVVDPEIMTEIMEADDELSAIARDVIARKRKEPGDDLLTALIRAEDGGDVLDDDELVAQVLLLYIAGHETTVNLIANASLALLRQPRWLDRLLADPTFAVPLVEEVVRWDPPVQFLPWRIALDDIPIGGTTIPKGASITLVLAAGNRDPGHVSDPDRFDPDRRPVQHLGFGDGIHYCFGAPMARLEAQVALRALAPVLARARLLEDPPEYRPSAVLRGPRHLRVALD
jgi:cytochrome P450